MGKTTLLNIVNKTTKTKAAGTNTRGSGTLNWNTIILNINECDPYNSKNLAQ